MISSPEVSGRVSLPHGKGDKIQSKEEKASPVVRGRVEFMPSKPAGDK
jgi:hypothetical protein